MSDIITVDFEQPDGTAQTSAEFFYVKRFKLIESDTLGFLQGSWLESKEYSKTELLDEFSLSPDFVSSMQSMFEAATHDGQWIKIFPLKNIRVIQ